MTQIPVSIVKSFIDFPRYGSLVIFLLLFLASTSYSQEAGSKVSAIILQKANHHFEEQQYDSAVILYKEFLSGSEFYKNHPDLGINNRQQMNMEARVTMQIANIYTLKGKYESAETWYYKALNLSGNWSRMKAEVYQNLGSLYFLKENFENAILYYQKSWSIYAKEPARNSGSIVDLMTSLGSAFSGNGEYLKSISCFRKADSVLKISRLNDPSRRAGLNLNIGEILIQLDAPSKALQYYRTARNLDSIKNISSTNILISSNQGMAWCYVQLGKMDSAMDCLTVCLELIKLTGTDMKNESSRILLTMGDIMAMKEEWEKSMKFYSLAEVFLIPDTSKPNIDKLSISNHDLDLYKVYEHRGRTYLQAARHSGYETATLACSFSDFLNALKICDHISKDFGQGPSRMKFHESIKPILAGAMESGYLLNEKKGNPGLDDLFYLADASKNRMLLDDMEECRSMKLSGVPDSTMEKIRHLKDQIVYYSRKYLKENPSPGTWQFSAMNEFQNKVINSKLELDSLREMIDRSYPDYSLKTKAEEKIHPARIIKSLDNDEALLEYVYADSIIYVFLIRADGSSMKRVVLPGSFTETLKESLHLSKSAGILKFSSLSRTLYQYLIAPVANRLNDIRRLIIIPDEELSLFPFETLISGDLQEPSDANPSSWHYLIRDFEITYHFSVEAWFKDTVMANLPSTSFRFAGFAPVFRKTPAKPGSLNLLPFTLKEVKGIAGLFGQRSMHQIVFLDTLATERNFRLHAPGNTHIHIATHSLISEKDPKNSALVFSKGNQYGGREDKDDGLLHLDEISNLRLGSSLVVLSACATGNGKVTRTEGVLALSRGFYLAGASNVVYSLWSIPDRLTSDFMMDFYRSYFTLNSYSAALREVKLKMISHPETSFPFMWAGIVLLGK